jgi:hypothetical protein
MKKVVTLLLMTFSLMSFSQEPKLDNKYINPTQYKMRLDFIQNRCRMLEDMFLKQYEKEELTADFAMFYMQMVRSLDSCASKLKQFKVASK